MKRIAYIFAAAVALITGACQQYSDDDTGRGGNGARFSLSLSVENHQSVMGTRATVSAEEGEENIGSLHLLFFEYSEDSTGTYINAYPVPGPFQMNREMNLNITDVSGLNNSTSYSILAVANLADGRYIDGSVSGWLAGFAGMTEKNAMSTKLARLEQAASESDNSKGILPSQLLMTGRATKTAGQQKVELSLIRTMVRLDVINQKNDMYDLVSASVWNVAVNTPLWLVDSYDPSTHLGRSYGVLTTEADASAEPVMNDIVGGLYTFENFVMSPAADDAVTTCVILGIRPRSNAPVADEEKGEVTYYRININPLESSQNIKRNNVYRVTVKNVIATGASSEQAALTAPADNLDYVINSWDLDDNGVILMDGINTLVIPAKRIVLNSEGDSREYTIFTQGPATLTVGETNLDNGLTATLMGNTLKVTGTAMLSTEQERNGTMEIILGSNKATIEIVQSKLVESYLTINRSGEIIFPGYGVNTVAQAEILVNSSGPWRAKIYNNNQLSANPGFSFSATDPKADATSQAELQGNTIRVYTSGTNDDSQASRTSILLVWLDGYEDYNRSLILTQQPGGGITITPEGQSTVNFNSGGTASNNATFTVSPGMSVTAGQLNQWNVDIFGDDSGYFSITAETNNTDPNQTQTFTITSSGTNTQGRVLSAVARIWLTNVPDVEPIEINISQGIVDWSVNGGNNITGLSASGEVTGYISVNGLPSDLTFDVQVQSTVPASLSSHRAFLLDSADQDVNELTGLAYDAQFRVRFPKLIWPNVTQAPVATIAVTVNETGETKTITVSQSAVTQWPVNIYNMKSGAGAMNSGTYTVNGLTTRFYGNFLTYYAYYLGYTPYFGVSGTYVRTNGNPTIVDDRWADNSSGAEALPESTRFVQYGRVTNNETAAVLANLASTVDTWRSSYEGITVLMGSSNSDRGTSGGFSGDYLPGSLGYTGLSSSISDYGYTMAQADEENRVVQYIINDGPFITGDETTDWWKSVTFTPSGEKSPIDPSSYTQVRANGGTPVPILSNSNSAYGDMLVIDPKNNMFYLGNAYFFGNAGTQSYSLAAPTASHAKLMGNMIAWIVNAAQYGTHFTDYFWDSDRYLENEDM